MSNPADLLVPILFISTKPLLTKAEQERLAALEQMTVVASGNSQDELKALQEKATRRRSIAEMIPIPIDGEVIPAQHIGANTQMNKNIELVGKEFLTTPTINVTTITLVTNTEGFYQTLADILVYLADISFSQHERSPDVAFFGKGAVIPKGFLVGLAKVGDSDSNREVITLSIARDTSDLIPTLDDVEAVSPVANTSTFGG
ncbi:hypothetical protein NVP1190O_16 [Vibrio phage 1.190.O._10N.286.51.F12]|nr:hypothetical protein NVP1190O_16 [Vibrio phage 1.190.O._10N.286.51.F12]